MSKINILDKHVAELIAAGEVVERPSSVIKELVENSIDSGALFITVEIKNGGITYMRVSDDGCGMSRDDVPKAFLRHATSKIKVSDDLDKIMTLGFRGEALASICAVSKVELITRLKEDIAGTGYKINGGEEEVCGDTGCEKGTTIIIRDLFFNIPARMKFLKKDIAEANAVAGIMDRIALSHPEISFKLIRDGREVLSTPGNGKLSDCIYAVFGKEFFSSLIPLNYELDGIKVHGFISKPVSSRPNRSMQHFFINGRYVKSKTAMVALEQGYKGSIMTGKFPSCVMNIELSCSAVDVNVHPAKIEVRFLNERPIFNAVYNGVKSALMEKDKTINMSLQHSLKDNKISEERSKQKIESVRFSDYDKLVEGSNVLSVLDLKDNDIKDTKYILDENSIGAVINNISGNMAPNINIESEIFVPQKVKFDLDDFSNFNIKEKHVNQKIDDDISNKSMIIHGKDEYELNEEIQINEQIKLENDDSLDEDIISENRNSILIGEVFNTYILIQKGKDGLILIDKHAAHERMIYNELKSANGPVDAQILIEPVLVNLEKNEYSIILENSDVLFEAGFEVDDFGSGSVLVRTAPLNLDGEDIRSSIAEIAGYMVENKGDLNTKHLDWLYHNVACRAAIKAGKNSKKEELLDLIKKLENDPEIRYCPHGRPVSVVISKREIEKQFGRV